MKYFRPTPLVISRPFQEPNNPYWQVTHLVADRLEPEFQRAILAVIAELVDGVKLHDLETGLENGSYSQVLRSINWAYLEEGLTDGVMDVFTQAMTETGNESVKLLPNSLGLSFDMTNPEAVTWVSVESARLVTNVTDETQAAIRQVIGRSFFDGIPPRQATREIKPLIGLLPQHANAVYNYRQRLTAEGKFSPAKIEDMANRYSQRLLTYRAEMIARTETIKGSCMGQQMMWRQAAEKGYLNPARVQRVWIVTHDDRLSKNRCAPMAGQKVGLEEMFTTGLGDKVLTPPAGPNCRCGVGLVFSK